MEGVIATWRNSDGTLSHDRLVDADSGDPIRSIDDLMGARVTRSADSDELPDLWTRLGLFIVTHAEEEIAVGIGRNSAGEYMALAEWGSEAEDSPMVGAAAYGVGHTAEGALALMLDDANA